MTDTLSRLAAILVDLNLDEAPITPDTRLTADLGADSLDMIEIVIEVEDIFDTEIDDEAALDCETAGDLVKLIDAAVAGRVAA